MLGWVALPVRMISSATDLASSIGIAKPTPMLPPCSPPNGPPPPSVAMAELMPTTSPRALTSAPPELPGLMAASVWIALNSGLRSPFSPGTSTVRLSALTMPVVTVPDRPSGEPMAMTRSPTTSPRDSPSVAAGSCESDCTCRTARSVTGSRPTIFAAISCSPASRVTVISPPPAADSTTWLLVRM